jgi:hypothetical protein
MVAVRRRKSSTDAKVAASLSYSGSGVPAYFAAVALGTGISTRSTPAAETLSRIAGEG